MTPDNTPKPDSVEESADLATRMTIGHLVDKIAALEHDLGTVTDKVLAIIDASGIEDIYNWGAPLREIREALAAIERGGDGK